MNATTQHLVIGSTGKTGRRVMAKLQALGYQPKGASRHDEVYFDWSEPSSWATALNNIDSVYLTYFPDLAVPNAPDDISRFCALAKLKGVKHVTLLSGRGEPAAQICENIVKQSDLSWTIVRASWFNQNFSEGMFRDYIIGGKIALPVGATTEPFIDVDDIADVVVASLTDSKHNGKLYEVTGPELLSFAQLSAKFTQHLASAVEFEAITIEQFEAGLTAAKVDQGTIAALIYLFTEVLDGRNECLADGVEQALGRKAKSFDDYIVDNKQYFQQ